MNVALFIDYYPPNHDGGDSIFARDLAIELTKTINPTVFTSLPKKNYTSWFEDNGAKVVYLGDSWKSDLESHIPSVDLLHFFQVDNLPIVNFIGSRKKIPKIFHMEMSYRRYSELLEPDFDEKSKHGLESLAVDISDKIIIPSKQELKEIARLYSIYDPNKLIVIPNGINFDIRLNKILDFSSNYEKIKFAFFGRLDDDMKGGELLIETLSKLPDNYLEKSSYVFIGCRDTRFLQKLDAIRDRIDYEVYGWISKEKQLWKLLSNVQYVLIPSLYETFGMVCLESMAMGIVPIASTAGAMGEIIRHKENGFLFQTNNSSEIAKAIKNSIDTTIETYLLMRNNAIHTSRERYSISRIVEKILPIYQNLVRGQCNDR